MIPNCDSCHQPMKLVKKGKAKSTKKHRIRRFHCSLCDIFTTIHADGMRDMVFEPLETSIKAKNITNPKDQDKLFKQLHRDINR